MIRRPFGRSSYRCKEGNVSWEFCTRSVSFLKSLTCSGPHPSTSRPLSVPPFLRFFVLWLFLEDQVMDYDAYDALLHHIFRQVRHDTSTTPKSFCLILFCRRKATHGSSRPRRTSTLASAFVSKRANTAYSLTRTASWSPSRRLSVS